MVAYLAGGQYRTANPGVCFAGTFAGLLLTDLAVSAQRWMVDAPDATAALIGIGAGQPLDGLILAPIAAAAVDTLQTRWAEIRMFRSRMKP